MEESVIVVGNIATCSDEMPRAEAAVVRDGRFIFVGTLDEAKRHAPKAKIVEYSREKLILPGFIDGHTHAFGGKMSELYMAHLNDADSLEAYKRIIRAFIEGHPEYEVYLGMGWSNGVFENHVPTAEILDAIESEKPVILQSGDWHSYWVNTAALRAAHIDKSTTSPVGGKIERDGAGNPVGCLRETAMSLLISILPRLQIAQYKTAILAAQEMFLSYGITAYMDMVLNFDESHEVFEAYESLDAEHRLKIDVFGGYLIDASDEPASEIACAESLRARCCGDRFRLTDIKIFIDGVVEGGTGFLVEPFATDSAYHGENRWCDAESVARLESIVALANRAGFSVHFHTVGDAAITVALDAIYAAQRNVLMSHDHSKANDNLEIKCDESAKNLGDIKGDAGDLLANPSRNALTHLQMVTPDQIMRMKLQNVLAVVNPYWFYKESGYHEVELHYLGEARAEREYPLQSLIASGVRVSMASDYPITPVPNPLLGIQTGVTRSNLAGDPESRLSPNECASVEDLIRAATLAAAYQVKAESEMGSIEAGKVANYIVLDKDITSCPPLEIAKSHVLETWVRGKCAYRR